MDYCSIFNEHFARLLDAVSNPVMLANHLSFADLIPSRIAMNIQTIAGEGVYEHSTRLFNEVRRLLKTVQGSEEQQKVIMQMFCGVLHDQDSPSLRILADQILKKTGSSFIHVYIRQFGHNRLLQIPITIIIIIIIIIINPST